MSSSYSSNLRVELIGSGDQAGTWGTTTDNNFNYIFDSAIAGAISVTIAGTPQALTAIQGPTSSSALNQAVYATLKLVSAPSAFTLYAPPASKQYIVWNATSYTATIGNATALGGTTSTGGATITLSAGEKALIWSDATNFYKIDSVATFSGGTTGLTPSSATAGAITLAGTLVVGNGGTGATTFTSGALLKGAGTSAVTTASAADIVGQIGSTAVTNATNATNATKLVTTNFTVEESGGNLLIKYGATTIVTIDSTGTITAG